MKKILAIILLTSLILTGCDSKKEESNNNDNNNPVNKVENVEQPKQENEENIPNEEEPTTDKEIEQETPIVKEDTNKNDNVSNTTENNKAEETPKKDTVVDSSSTVIEQPKEEIVEPEEPSCTAKKFNNKYSYVYTTKEECISKGNNAYMDVYDNIDDTIFTYGCEQIVDDCGTTWYGVYFNRWSDSGGDDVIRVYY